MSMEMPTSQRFKTWFWEIGAIAFIALALNGSAKSHNSREAIDCARVFPPPEQTVTSSKSATFLVRLAEQEAPPMRLAFREVPDGYYIDFGHPGENLLISSSELESSDGHVVALITGSSTSLVTRLKKSEGEPAIVTASCVENHVPEPGNYATGKIVP